MKIEIQLFSPSEIYISIEKYFMWFKLNRTRPFSSKLSQKFPIMSELLNVIIVCICNIQKPLTVNSNRIGSIKLSLSWSFFTKWVGDSYIRIEDFYTIVIPISNINVTSSRRNSDTMRIAKLKCSVTFYLYSSFFFTVQYYKQVILR